MTAAPLDAVSSVGGWPDSLLTAHVAAVGAVTLVTECGHVVQVDAARWHRPASAADHSVIQRCRGPVLDIGSGPGRMLTALSAQGIPCLGIDVSAGAVARARAAGGDCVEADVFAPLPAEGTWSSALLLDGNIGIGGDPARLLRRVAAVVAADATVIVEVDHVHRLRSTARRVRVTHDHVPSAWFAWAVVSVDELPALADDAGWAVAESWTLEDRCFQRLVRSGHSA